MKFLSNTHDPNDKNARIYVSIQPHETLKEAIARHTEWLKGKVIGEPQATEAYTVAQLKEMGMVGVYMPNTSAYPTCAICGDTGVAGPTWSHPEGEACECTRM